MSPRNRFYDDEETEIIRLPTEKLEASSPFKVAPEEDAPLPTAEVFHIQAPEQTQQTVKSLRQWINSKANEYQYKSNRAYNHYTSVGNKVIKTIADLKHQEESLLPSSIYVLTSTLTGSILTRNKGIALRFISPLFFGVSSFKYLLPKTSTNIESFIWKAEKEYLAPEVTETQTSIKTGLIDFKQASINYWDNFNSCVTNQVKSTRRSLAGMTDGIKEDLKLPDAVVESTAKKQ